MSTENFPSSDLMQNKIIKPKTSRKIYNRNDFFLYYNCSAEIPDYLKDFQFLYNNFTEENWCIKPLPKFDEVPESKGKSVYPNNKSKGRQRTLSNQSGEYVGEHHDNYNKRTYTSNGKFNRYGNSPNEINSTEDIKTDLNSKFINLNDFQDNPEGQWQKVEPRANRLFNASKPYSQNIQVTENHWKKWSKDSNSATDKIHKSQSIPFNRSEKPNNIWLRKSDSDNRQRSSKVYGRHSVSKSGDQTEDIWQDDWDTEMKSEIAKDENELILDSFEFPKSSILSITPPPMEPESKLINPIFDTPTDPVTPEFDMWFYRDLSNIERGPYTSENMANWLATGYFDPTTFVRRMCDERYLLLAEYRALYGRIPFTAGPAVPPILLNTPIEIELQQLLIGVEVNLIQKVINCAHNPLNVIRVEDNLNITPNNAILVEKRLLDESRAELERERERMIQEQIQWRARVEAELHAKMQAELNAKVEEILLQQSIAVVNVGKPIAPVDQNISPEQLSIESDQPINNVVRNIVENAPQPKDCEKSAISVKNKHVPVIDEANIQQAQINNDNNHWFSTKDMKIPKKNKKSKAKENKNVKEEKEAIVSIPEVKHSDQPMELSIVTKESLHTALKENVTTAKVRPIKFEMDHRRNEPPVSRTTLPNVVHLPANVKSLVEIQAEESEKIKKEKESHKVSLSSETETSKFTGKPIKIESSTSTKPSLAQMKATVPIVTKSLLEIQAEEIQAVKEKQAKDLQSISKISEVRTTGNPIKTETLVSWKSPPILTSTVPPVAKSLLEIQAEEAMNEKRNKQLQNAAKTNEIDANKITSFKESLLKSPKQPQIPIGKSIWDMLPAETSVNKMPVQTSEPLVKKDVVNKIQKDCSKESNVTKKVESDQLTLWCLKKLAKFSDKFELNTVIELLKQVPNEEVMELALQLLDDSKFTSTFVVEFINKRQELSYNQAGDTWQTVKKSIPSPPPVNNSKSKSAKSKSKKKMVVIDTKFR